MNIRVVTQADIETLFDILFYRHLGWVDAGIQSDGQVKFVKRRPPG